MGSGARANVFTYTAAVTALNDAGKFGFGFGLGLGSGLGSGLG